jgi:ribonuclease HI
MSFRGDSVWVLVDQQGRMVLDSGRAEMRYRVEDTRSYRPAAANLSALPGGGEVMASAAEATPRARSAGSAPAKTARAGAEPPQMPAGNAVHVWTDGACSGNPGPMGIGVVVLTNGDRRELGEYLGTGTNNIAELTAIERGLGIAAELLPAWERPVRVYTDSAYAIGLLSKEWKAKANKELVARLRDIVAGIRDLVFVKVEGHSGVPENERCDELARMAIETRNSKGSP